MKKYLYSLLILVLSFIFIPSTYAFYETVDPSIKVHDFAERLSESEENTLKESIAEFTEKYNLDLVVVVKNDYTGVLKSYAEDFYDYNNFGVGSTHDGLILVLNYDSLGIDCYISTTGEAILMYDDARISGLMRSMSAVKTEPTVNVVSAFISQADYYASIGKPSSNNGYTIDKNGELVKKKVYPIAIPVVSLIVTVVTILIMLNKHKMIKKASTAREYLDRSSINFTNKRDVFLNTHTSKVRLSSDSSSGGGGSGSSTSHGSSGTSHGGGGGRL